MKIETTTSPSHATVTLRGDFDTDAASSFFETVNELQANAATRLMVSFRYVKYINSTALGAVVRARTSCRERGGDLVIVRPSRLTHDIITKMGLDRVLPIFDDEAVAAAFLGGRTDSAAGEAPMAPAGERTDEDVDQTIVMFSFADERAQLLPGKSRHGVGVLESVDSANLVFRWQPAQSGCEASTAAALFTVGSTMRNKLQIKLMRKGFFEADSTIVSLTLNPEGEAVVTSRWSRIGEADRQALDRHRDDVVFLQKQAGKPSVDRSR